MFGVRFIPNASETRSLEMQRFLTPTTIRKHNIRRTFSFRRNNHVLRTGQLVRAQAIVSGLERQKQLSFVAGAQQLLRYNMRCPMRTAYAIGSYVQIPDGRVRAKRQLHITIEVDGEIDLASAAMNV